MAKVGTLENLRWLICGVDPSIPFYFLISPSEMIDGSSTERPKLFGAESVNNIQKISLVSVGPFAEDRCEQTLKPQKTHCSQKFVTC